MYGNSHTSFLESTLRTLIKQSGAPLKLVVRAEPSSQFMIIHLKRALANEKDWAPWHVKPDYVIFQEQSGLPTHHNMNNLLNFTKSENSFAAMTYLVKNFTQADVAIYFTFIHHTDRADIARTHYELLSEGFEKYQKKMHTMQKHVPIVPVGHAFEYIRKGNTEWFSKLYDNDGRHFSKYGAYLTACVFISTFASIRMGGKWVPHEEDEFYSKLQIASDYVVFKTHNPWKSSNSIWDHIYEMIFGNDLELDPAAYEDFLRNSIHLKIWSPSTKKFGILMGILAVGFVMYWSNNK